MAATSLQLALGQSCSTLTMGLPLMSKPLYNRTCIMVQGIPKDFRMKVFSNRAAKVWCGKLEGPYGEDGMTPERLQEFLWLDYFTDPTQWWDNRRSKKTPRHPDFKHKRSKQNLWLTDWNKPAWVDSKLAAWDAGLWRPPALLCNSDQGISGRLVEHEGDLEVERCRRLCDDGQVTEAVNSLNLLVQRGCHVPNNLFYHVLKGCIAQKDLVLGRRIHALAVDRGYEGNAFLATHLIGMYASHRRLGEAMHIFSKLADPSAQNWASIIFAFARHGEPSMAIKLYQQMRESTVQPDNRIFVAALTACASARDLATGKDVHAHILASAERADMFVQTCLVDMYAKCGNLEDARRVFDGLLRKNVVTWTAMIAGYAQHGQGQEALTLYSSMQSEGLTLANSVTFLCLLQACANVGVAALQQGKQLHAQIEEQGLQGDVVIGASLVNMYGKCGSVENAQRVFDSLPDKDVVTWTAMITAYAQLGMGQQALGLYSSMQQNGIAPPDAVAFVCLLQACASVGVVALHQGMQLHVQIEEQGLQDDLVVGASLVSMYAKCGSAGNSRRVFDRLSQKNVVTWNAMIAGYAQQGMAQEALSLHATMQQENFVEPNAVTYVSLLQACASVAALPLGKQLHAQIEERGLQADVVVGSSLVNMYAKCGSLEEAQHVFDSLAVRDIVAWSAIIAGYTSRGESEIVFNLVDRMMLEGIHPNSVTFLSLLTVCSHVGLVDKGRKYFEAMVTDYRISPTIEHYTCMMDLLGRAGHLDEALQMAKTMPLQPNGAVWLSLLGSCRKWSNVEVGERAFEFAVSLDERDAASYVLMSNIYAEAHMWDKAKEIQARRSKFGAWKQPGQTWASDSGGLVHTFLVRDMNSPRE